MIRPGVTVYRTRWSYPRVQLAHKHLDGSPVLLSESSWSTVSGVILGAFGRLVWVEFR